MLLVLGKEPKRHWNLRCVEQLGRHGDDTVHQIVLDDVFSDLALAAGLGGQGAVGQHHADAPTRGQVPDHVLEPREVGVAGGRRTVLPAHIVQQLLLPPAGEVEGRISHNIVGLELGVAVVEKGVSVEFPQVRLDSPDGQIHLGHLPGGRVGVLTKDGNLIDVAAVVFHKLCRLHKHSTAAAAGIIDPPIERLQHLYQCADHTGGRVKFSRQFTLLLREFGQAVFVGSAQDILTLAVLDHLDIGEQIDYFPQPALVQL